MVKVKIGKDWTEIPVTKGTLKVIGNGSVLVSTHRTKPDWNYGFEIGGWEEMKTFESIEKLWAKSKDGKDIYVLADNVYFDTLSTHRMMVPAVLQSVEPTSSQINVGDTVKVTWTFDKAPYYEDVVNVDPVVNNSHLSRVGEALIGGNTIYANYKGVTQGETTVSLTVDGVTKAATITVAQG